MREGDSAGRIRLFLEVSHSRDFLFLGRDDFQGDVLI